MLSDEDIDAILERFDATAPKLRRRIIVETMIALEESVTLQSHYASLLNDYDGGKRRQFETAAAWMTRLRECGKL